jgi:erythromycin esterase-like protein
MLRIVGPAAFLFLTGVPGVAAHGQSDPAVEWIRANAIRLSTLEAGHGFADMQALKSLIGNARIVSLGEATHGTREFFQLKHRMLELLATEMGFTIFSIEANMPEAYRLNDYVLNGTGDPAELLRGMYFWTWNTEEVLEMIRWMRAFNASGRGRVQFSGFDMQTHTVALDIVQQFVRRYDSATSRRWEMRAAGFLDAAAAGSSFPPPARSRDARGRQDRRFSGMSERRGDDGVRGIVVARGRRLARRRSRSTTCQRGAQPERRLAAIHDQLPVDGSARNINFGLLMPGNGTAWFDDLTVELDGQPFVDSIAFDFGFESASPRGFFTSGNGYRVTLDNTVARSGRQSLRMTRVAAADAAPPADRTAVVAQWSDLLTHLERQRASYRALGAGDSDIDWAIQNARVVLQAVQMRLGLVSRDRSMALNVKWILDQNPNAKLVLWAHNGHVARGRMMLRSMGEELHDMFGAQMVVLGFAFNRGSFQAIGARGGGLQNFTVGPAPPARSTRCSAQREFRSSRWTCATLHRRSARRG